MMDIENHISEFEDKIQKQQKSSKGNQRVVENVKFFEIKQFLFLCSEEGKEVKK